MPESDIPPGTKLTARARVDIDPDRPYFTVGFDMACAELARPDGMQVVDALLGHTREMLERHRTNMLRDQEHELRHSGR